MYTNASLSSETLLAMESLNIPPGSMYPTFIFGTLTYLLILFFNLLVISTIAINRKLHKPMFILLLNLPTSDIIGSTAFFPQLLLSMISQNRYISYPACFTQGLLIHIYGTGNLLSLTAMAYDRYIAICLPLRYNSIMAPYNLVKMIILIWVIDLALILTLLGLVARSKICSTKIVDIYCNNPSLMKLVCEDTRLNNYYGLFTIVLTQGGSLALIVYTYIQILITCMVSKHADSKAKAIQLCGTHLVIFLLLQINTACVLIAHRFENAFPFMRRVLGASVLIFPPFLNPLIYGLNTKELRQNVLINFKRMCIRSS